MEFGFFVSEVSYLGTRLDELYSKLYQGKHIMPYPVVDGYLSYTKEGRLIHILYFVCMFF
jgi:hypothetical protein